jgi:hypothetical protein
MINLQRIIMLPNLGHSVHGNPRCASLTSRTRISSTMMPLSLVMVISVRDRWMKLRMRLARWRGMHLRPLTVRRNRKSIARATLTLTLRECLLVTQEVKLTYMVRQVQ